MVVPLLTLNDCSASSDVILKMVLMTCSFGDIATPGVPHLPDGGLRHGVRWADARHGHRLAGIQGILVPCHIYPPES